MRGLPWEPVNGLLEFPATEIHEDICEFEITTPAILLESFTRDPSVGERMREELQRNMTFADFTRECFEPYILPEVGKRFHEAEAQLPNFVESRQTIFQKQMVDSANTWITKLQKAFKHFARSGTLLRGRVAALEHIVKHGYKIDSDSDVIMQAAAALLLVEAPPIEYAPETAAYMVRAEWQSYLTELATTYMQQPKTIRLQQEQLTPAQSTQTRLFSFSEGVTAALMIRAQSASPAGNPPGVHKNKKPGKAKEKQPSSGKPSAPSIQRSGLPATPTQQTHLPAHPAVEPMTPAIQVQPERPFAVAAATPIPATPHNPTVPAAQAKCKPGWGDSPGPSAQSATAYCSDGCRM